MGADYVSAIAEHVATYHSDAVKVGEAPGKGRILLAARDFEAGERILLEYPLVEVVADKRSPAYAALVRLRAEGRLTAAPPLFYWAALCSLTAADAATAAEALGTWPHISAGTQAQALLLHAPDDACEAPSETTRAVAAEFWPCGGGPDLARLERLLQVFIYNSFDQGGGEDALEAGGIYLAASMLSHSCAPNAAWHLDDANSFHLHAREHIKEGEEVSISYLGVADLCLPAADRREILSATKDFVCSCERCETRLEDTRVFDCPRCLKPSTALAVAAAAAAEGDCGGGGGGGGGRLECSACGALSAEESAPALSCEARLRPFARALPEFHQLGGAAGPGDDGDGKGADAAAASKWLACAEEGGLSGTHWAVDALRAAVSEQVPERHLDLLERRADAYAAAPPWALSKAARLAAALGRALGGRAAGREELQRAVEAYDRAVRGLATLFGEDDPEHREVEDLREAAARRLAAAARRETAPTASTAEAAGGASGRSGGGGKIPVPRRGRR